MCLFNWENTQFQEGWVGVKINTGLYWKLTWENSWDLESQFWNCVDLSGMEKVGDWEKIIRALVFLSVHTQSERILTFTKTESPANNARLSSYRILE